MVPICPGGGMVDTGDLKSPGHCDRAGSSPAPGTTIWNHRQVGKAAACKAAIRRFESGWFLHVYKLEFIYL